MSAVLITLTGGNSTTSFETGLFQFKMSPPQILQFQHLVQNGNTLIDRISFKDKFEITFPFVTQSEYNHLIDICQSVPNPFITVDYQTDGIERLWDGITSYSSSISLIDTQIANFLYPDYNNLVNYGLLVTKDTLNLFINPNADNGDTNAEVEDSVTTKKNLTISASTAYTLWGSHSFKADNTNINDYTPESVSAATLLSGIGRPGFDTSGAIQVLTGYTSLLLYNSSPFINQSSHWTISYTSIDLGIGYVYGPHYCYRTETISPGSNTYTFQLSLDYLSMHVPPSGGNITLTISDNGSQTNTAIFNYSAGYYGTGHPLYGFISVTKTFSSSPSSHIRCRIDFNNIDYIIDSISYGGELRLQLVQEAFPLPWVDTSSGSPVVVSPDTGLLYKAPLSLCAYDGVHLEPPVAKGETQSPQSVSLWFKSLG